jgi:TonB-dependent receptor
MKTASTHIALLLVASPLALAATAAFAQVGSTAPAPDEGIAADQSSQGADIIVTGIRSSLERAAEVKQNSTQVVDSIVAQDISKFPDPSVASALQRVAGVQVSNDNHNELGGVRIRGLTDILTTVDGREVFTTTDRNFDLQDMPADALSRVDVYKSQTADLIEGGVAGAINLRLNKPFNFTKPTVVLTARSNYGLEVEKLNPQFGALATDRWNTGIGEIGALVSASWSDSDALRSNDNLTDRRNSAAGPLKTPGYFIPNILQNVTHASNVKRREANAALQWQASNSLEVYLDGLYTQFKSRDIDYGFNVQPFTSGVTVSDIHANSHCFDVRSKANGQNPNLQTAADGTDSLEPSDTVNLCDIDSAVFHNAVVNRSTGVHRVKQTNKLVAGGFRYDNSRGSKLDFDLGYQTSRSFTTDIRTALGDRLPELTLETKGDGGERITVPNDALIDREGLSYRNQLQQDYGDARGSLFQARLDGEQEIGGFLDSIKVGMRYAKRTATFLNVHLNKATPFGNVGTGSEAKAKRVSDTELFPDFIGFSEIQPRINGGARFTGPNGEFMLSEDNLDRLRAIYELPAGRPAYDPLRQFDADEATYAAYGQAHYEADFGGGVSLDGVVGARLTKTDRTVVTFDEDANPIRSHTSDTDVLPNATARLRVPGGFQARLGYSKAIRRPDFGSLNPAVKLIIDVNPAQLSTGSAGNPDLLPQKADSYDATIEHYWKSGFISIAGYYRKITNRVISAGAQEEIDGTVFIITRPRNVGRAKLQGIEVSGQNFFDFLPGALDGLGVMGSFTYADSKVQGDDSLAGEPLQGVSKYNYTAGLLYEKYGVSARVVYTYRSRYYTADLTGQPQLRRFDPAVTDVVPTLLEYVRPAGRLDFSVGYDLNERLHFDIGGTNVLRNNTRTYRGEPFFTGNYFYDETTYTIGVRYRF